MVVGAGALLATLSILLAAWSKELVKEGLRQECAEYAGFLSFEMARAHDERVRDLVVAGRRPAESAAVWRLAADGRVLSSDPPDAGTPPETFVRAALDHTGRGALPITLRGPAEALAATWAPLPELAADGARGLLVRWDLAAVQAQLLGPLVARRGGTAGRRLEVTVVPDTGLDVDPPVHARAAQTLPPPFDRWRVLVGLEDPAGVRWTLRVQTFLLFALAAWLLLLLAAGVVAWMRRERAHAARLLAREQLLARAYHELQTPLMLLRAAAESLERGAVEREDEKRRCVSIIAREEERLTRTIRRLLRWLRAEGGDERDVQPVREEVEAAVRDQEPALRERGIRVELALDGAAAALRAPRDLVADVVRELLVNVEKHARGATRVRIELGLGERGAARIVIDDDGPGWQDQQPSSGVGSGFGLGLLREGLLLCGGRLVVEPAVGARGARVVVEVPARAQAR